MKRKIACTIAGATGVISGSFIFQACEKAESADELNQMLESNIQANSDTIGIPIGVPLTIQDQDYISFLRQLSLEIVSNPIAANEFANDPEAYCHKYGYSQQLNLDQGLIKLIMALGNKEINDSINEGNINTFVKACKKNGLLELGSLNQDPYLMRLSDFIQKERTNSSLPLRFGLTKAGTRANQDFVNDFSAVYGAVAIVVAAVAVEAFVFIGTTTWVTHVHQKEYQSLDYQSKNSMVEIWGLKANSGKDYFIADNINAAIAEEGLLVIKENFPEVYETIDKNALRNLILLNVSKNMPHEE